LKIKLEEILPGDEIEEQELDQKRKTMPPRLQFFLSFFSAQLPRLSSFLLSANHVFNASF
jgi:hypothetical protein